MHVTVAASAPLELTAPSPPAPLGAVDPRSTSLQNSCVETLTPNVVCQDLRPLGGDGHEGGTSMNGVCAFIEDAPDSSLVFPPQEDTAGDQPAATQERVSPEPAHTGTPSQLPDPGP